MQKMAEPSAAGWSDWCRILETKEQVQAAVFGIYASLTGSATGSRVQENHFCFRELRADMITSTHHHQRTGRYYKRKYFVYQFLFKLEGRLRNHQLL